MSIVTTKDQVKKALIKRWTELGLYSEHEGRHSYAEIVRDAKERMPELKFTTDRFSKWINNYSFEGKSPRLTELQIAFLCARWLVPVNTYMGDPVVRNGRVEFEMPVYSELEALSRIKEFKKLYMK